MTEETDDTRTTETAPGGASTLPASKGPPLFIVAAALVIVAVGGWAAWVYINGGDEFNFRRFAFLGEEKFEFHKVTGRVFFNGEPLGDGHLALYPADGSKGADRMFGPIDKDGNFELFSDFGGRLSVGAPAGEYKALLDVSYPTLPLQPPIHMLPPEYYDVSKTPIRITVSSDPEKNHIIIEEEGEIQPNTRPSRPDGDAADGDSADGGPAGGAPGDEGDGDGSEVERPAGEVEPATNDSAA